MANEMQVFQNDEFGEVCTVMRDGEARVRLMSDLRTGTATKPKWVEGRAKRLLWIPRDKMK